MRDDARDAGDASDARDARDTRALDRRAGALFDALLDLPADARAAQLDDAAAHDTALKAEVAALLHAYEASEGALEAASRLVIGPLMEQLRQHAAAQDTQDPQGARGAQGAQDAQAAQAAQAAHGALRLGPFRAVREIGRGGMGVVYLGERDDGQFEQRVALKLMRHAASDVQHRFLEERRILARLEHAGIARLIDGGLADGSAWLAMELVDGEAIDRYCDARALGLRDRLALFLEVCDAVGYAHRHLVVHRDLKPSNILVTAAGSVKLLDFGIAAFLDQAGGAVMPGLRALTPEFAAPEQAMGGAISTAADIYSLGVLLYLLLSGERPHAGAGHAVAGSGQAPPPSERARAPWRRQLRGDLDAIVLKCMSRDPAARYTSVELLADDIIRFRAGRTVHARPRTPLYRARRFVVRHRAGVGAACVITALAAAQVVSATLHQRRIAAALEDARTGAARAEEVTAFLLGLFEAQEYGPAAADSVTARALLARGAAAAREVTARPAVRAQLLDAVGLMHVQAGDHHGARELFGEALDARRRALGDDHVDVATSMAHLASALHELGEPDSATRLLRRALAIQRERLGGADPATLETLYSLALTLHGAGEHGEAWQLFSEWMGQASNQPAGENAARAHQYVLLAQLLTYGGDAEGGVALLERAVALREGLLGPDHPVVARTRLVLAASYMEAGRFDVAEHETRRAVQRLAELYPEGHPELAKATRDLGVALHRQRRWDEAERYYLDARAMMRRVRGADHTYYATVTEDLGMLLVARGDGRRAEPYLREALELYRARAGASSLLSHRAAVLLGTALLQKGDSVAAEGLLVQGVEALAARSVPGFRGPARRGADALARLYEASGRLEEAARYRAVEKRLGEAGGPQRAARLPGAATSG